MNLIKQLNEKAKYKDKEVKMIETLDHELIMNKY